MSAAPVPVAARDRIAVLDIIRGLAILGILFLNMPGMGHFTAAEPQFIGWSAIDRDVWLTIAVVLEGTQRGLLELLFGGGLMIMAARAMAPDGPVAIADLWYRRNLWLFGFGLLHAFVFLWFGEILTTYGLAALLVFPFRRIAPARLFTAALALLLLFDAVGGAVAAHDRRHLLAAAPAIVAADSAGTRLDSADSAILADWRDLQDGFRGGENFADEAEAHNGSIAGYVAWCIQTWIDWSYSLPKSIIEAALSMAIGMALYGWGILQGRRTPGFYGRLMLIAYAIGLPLRFAEVQPVLALQLEPHWTWSTAQAGRIAMTLGHLALIHLVFASTAGNRLLRPFAACGQLPLSLYFTQSLVTMWWLFAPLGPGLWGRLGWAELMALAGVIIAVQVVIANVWVRHFANGPFEWLWKSLSYLAPQPFRRRA